MADAFEVVVDTGHPNVAVVRVRGRLDGRTSPEVLQLCLSSHEHGRPLVLNLSDVTFLSSAGVGVLMVLQEKLGTRGALRLAPVSKAVRTVLGLLNLDPFLPIDESEGDAVAALGA